MTTFTPHPVPEEFARNAHINRERYDEMYERSINDADAFWSEQAEEFLTWDAPWNSVCEYDFPKGEARWFDGGKLNVSANCIDRHLATRADQTAIIWEGDDPADSRHITYAELHSEVCKLANVLKDRGVSAGDRVCI